MDTDMPGELLALGYCDDDLPPRRDVEEAIAVLRATVRAPRGTSVSLTDAEIRTEAAAAWRRTPAE